MTLFFSFILPFLFSINPDCLHHLLFQLSSSSLPIQVPLIVSNHPTFAPLAAAHGIPFYHLPIDDKSGKTKEWQEDQLLKLCKQYDVELVVLARYMQVSKERRSREQREDEKERKYVLKLLSLSSSSLFFRYRIIRLFGGGNGTTRFYLQSCVRKCLERLSTFIILSCLLSK